ncbi:DHPS1 [Scenedesmus sp. PABB004]|nr:DHPS1 [Scenedesmus sp. PABB004]
MALAGAAQRAGVRPARPAGRRPLAVRAVLATPLTAKEKQSEVASLKSCALITAIKTPYLPNGKFDLKAYDRLLDLQVAHGVEGVIVGGTTGEGHLMSWDEHIMLIAHTVNAYGDRLKVIGNTGSNSTGEALHATEQGFAVGMHAALQINPYYGKTSLPGLRAHFGAVLGEGPAIIYNVPGRTGQDIPSSLVDELAAHPNFLGMKECTGNARIGGYTSGGVNAWSGNDDEAHDARHGAGAAGVISVTSNLLPGLFARMMAGPEPELNASLQELIAWLFCEPNPIPLNTALMMCGLVRPVWRLPYVPLERAQRERGAALLRAVQEHIPGCTEVRVMEDDEFMLVGSAHK